MFRTSYVLHQEDYILHAAVYGIFLMEASRFALNVI